MFKRAVCRFEDVVSTAGTVSVGKMTVVMNEGRVSELL